MSRRRTAAGVLLAIGSLAIGSIASAEELKRTVKPDVESRITVHTNAFQPYPGNISCNQGGPVTLELVTPPRNGDVAFRPAPEKLKNCSNELMGTGVFYKPKPGFRGTDTFSYNRSDAGVRAVTTNRPEGVKTVVVEVR
jgi:hypothetical protein